MPNWPFGFLHPTDGRDRAEVDGSTRSSISGFDTVGSAVRRDGMADGNQARIVRLPLIRTSAPHRRTILSSFTSGRHFLVVRIPQAVCMSGRVR